MTKKEQSKQTMWETWFVISLILLGVMILIGLMDNSKIYFPNWPYITGVIIINLLICIRIGTHKN